MLRIVCGLLGAGLLYNQRNQLGFPQRANIRPCCREMYIKGSKALVLLVQLTLSSFALIYALGGKKLLKGVASLVTTNKKVLAIISFVMIGEFFFRRRSNAHQNRIQVDRKQSGDPAISEANKEQFNHDEINKDEIQIKNDNLETENEGECEVVQPESGGSAIAEPPQKEIYVDAPQIELSDLPNEEIYSRQESELWRFWDDCIDSWNEQSYRAALNGAANNEDGMLPINTLDHSDICSADLVEALHSDAFLKFPGISPFDKLLAAQIMTTELRAAYITDPQTNRAVHIARRIWELSAKPMLTDPVLFAATFKRMALVIKNSSNPPKAESVMPYLLTSLLKSPEDAVQKKQIAQSVTTILETYNIGMDQPTGNGFTLCEAILIHDEAKERWEQVFQKATSREEIFKTAVEYFHPLPVTLETIVIYSICLHDPQAEYLEVLKSFEDAIPVNDPIILTKKIETFSSSAPEGIKITTIFGKKGSLFKFK